MDLQPHGKRALITGGSGGIGGAVAERLAKQSANVAICAQEEVAVQNTVAALRWSFSSSVHQTSD